MFEFISGLPTELIISGIIIIVGIIVAIIKKMLKIAIQVLSVVVLLFVIYKLAVGFLGNAF